MKNVRLFWMFAIAIADLFFAKSSLAQLPPVGAQIAGNLSIASDYRPYNISLPPGNWQVASLRYEEVNKFHDFTLSQSAGIEAKAFGEIALIQITGGKILGLIAVKARLKTSSKIRTPSICGDQQRHNHLNTYGLRPPQVIKCLQVKPLDWSMTDQSQLFEGIKGYLAKQGIKYPVDMVGFQFTEEASRPGRYLEYSYYVNPDIWGYPNTASPVDRSPWVQSTVQRDPNKASFMIALIVLCRSPTHSVFESILLEMEAQVLGLSPLTHRLMQHNDLLVTVSHSRPSLHQVPKLG